MQSSLRNFEKLARISLSNLDTPIEGCGKISGGRGSRLFIKRDDFIGSLVWGNKLRKLEYSIAEALSRGADTIITCGGVQSNHARITAQVCKRLGLKCILVQNGEKPAFAHGNHKINLMLGIPIHYVATSQDREPKMQELYDELQRQGARPYIIPLGASNAAGCPGFVNAARELMLQQKKMGIEFDYLVHATSSGGTQAGLEIGKRLFGMGRLQIIGVSADNSVEHLTHSILQCAQPLLEKLDAPFSLGPQELNIDTGFIGDGYGIPSPESRAAMELFMAQGIMLDHTYTSKAAAGLLSYMCEGEMSTGKNILFWHTGGIMAEI